MSTMKYPGFFDIVRRTDKLKRMSDPLVGLSQRIDWEALWDGFCLVHEKPREYTGAKPIEVVLMFKVPVLQQLHNLSDDGIELQIRDRLWFTRFLGHKRTWAGISYGLLACCGHRSRSA